jgi:hypothetical protein
MRKKRFQQQEKYKIIGARGSLYSCDAIFQKQHSILTRRISREVYLKETNSSQRNALLEALNEVLEEFLSEQRPVFLDGLGILEPVVVERDGSYTAGNFAAVRSEKILTVTFEKCDDSSAIDSLRFKNIVDTAELATACSLRLPPEQCISWLEKDTRRYLRGLLKQFKHSLVEEGVASELSSVGTFFALHNRQGETPADWFAGSDIGLSATIEKRIAIESPTFFERPVLENSFELLQAAFGSPVLKFEVHIAEELENLGYDSNALQSEGTLESCSVPVAVFEAPSPRSDNERVLIYCTNGLRQLGLAAGHCGAEVTFQLATTCNGSTGTDLKVPTWVSRPIAMAWILLQSSPKKNLRPGLGLSCDLPLRPRFDTDMNTIFLTPFKHYSGEALSAEGPFHYINVVGISACEAAIAQRMSDAHLQRLLKHKGYEQITYITRSSIARRLELPALQSRAEHTAPTAILTL